MTIKNKCHKKKYNTEDKAVFVMNKIWKKNKKGKKPVRAYKCNSCSSWHLTSQSDERRKRKDPEHMTQREIDADYYIRKYKW